MFEKTKQKKHIFNIDPKRSAIFTDKFPMFYILDLSCPITYTESTHLDEMIQIHVA